MINNVNGIGIFDIIRNICSNEHRRFMHRSNGGHIYNHFEHTHRKEVKSMEIALITVTCIFSIIVLNTME